MTAFNVESILRDQLSGFDDDLLNYVVSMVEEMSLEEKVICVLFKLFSRKAILAFSINSFRNQS